MAILAVFLHRVMCLELLIAVVTIRAIGSALAGRRLRSFYAWGGSFGSSEPEGWDFPSIAEVSACILRSYKRPKKLDSKLLRAGWLPSIV
jgi:hypothetical protein